MNQHDSQYLDLCSGLLHDWGRRSSDRTGTGTTKAAGLNMRFAMKDGFPLLTSKFVPMKAVELELRMFLNGITNNNFLKDQGVNIWNAWAHPVTSELGPIYGAMWRRWPDIGSDGLSHDIDQIEELMKGLKEKPTSRRHIVTGWNPALLPLEGRSHEENVMLNLQVLPPCHTMWQVHCFELTAEERFNLAVAPNFKGVRNDRTDDERVHLVCDGMKIPRYEVSLQLYQRSADMFLGVPFNIASYSLLLHYIAHSLNMIPGDFIWNGGDCHIYNNHEEQMNIQFDREAKAPASPTIKFNCAPKDLWDYTADDFEIVGYEHLGAIKGAVAV